LAAYGATADLLLIALMIQSQVGSGPTQHHLRNTPFATPERNTPNGVTRLFSQRDYAQKIALKGRTSPTTAVREIMSTRVICARPLQTVEECMAIMTAKAVRHLPVLEDKKIIGLVSIGDMVKGFIADQKFIIEQLEHYI
jgi:CBS domain-containing protein